MEEITEQLARHMYDTYCEAVGGLSFKGEPLPHSSDFFEDSATGKQANAWRKAAEASINFLDDMEGAR